MRVISELLIFCMGSQKTHSLLPSEVHASHLVELQIMGVVEVPQFPNDLRVNTDVGPAFGLAQAVGLTAALGLFEAREALGLVEVEVFVCDDALQPQEVLHAAQLSGWVTDEPLSVDKVDLREREVGQPSLQVPGVHADVQRAPERVDLACRPVLKGQALEAGHVGRLGDDLGVVRDRPGDGVPDHHDQLHVPGHGMDTSRCLRCHEVPRRLLHHYLSV